MESERATELKGGAVDEAKWKERYIVQLVKGGLDKESAEDTYLAGLDCHDFAGCPEGAAEGELSYWNE